MREIRIRGGASNGNTISIEDVLIPQTGFVAVTVLDPTGNACDYAGIVLLGEDYLSKSGLTAHFPGTNSKDYAPAVYFGRNGVIVVPRLDWAVRLAVRDRNHAPVILDIPIVGDAMSATLLEPTPSALLRLVPGFNEPLPITVVVSERDRTPGFLQPWSEYISSPFSGDPNGPRCVALLPSHADRALTRTLHYYAQDVRAGVQIIDIAAESTIDIKCFSKDGRLLSVASVEPPFFGQEVLVDIRSVSTSPPGLLRTGGGHIPDAYRVIDGKGQLYSDLKGQLAPALYSASNFTDYFGLRTQAGDYCIGRFDRLQSNALPVLPFEAGSLLVFEDASGSRSNVAKQVRFGHSRFPTFSPELLSPSTYLIHSSCDEPHYISYMHGDLQVLSRVDSHIQTTRIRLPQLAAIEISIEPASSGVEFEIPEELIIRPVSGDGICIVRLDAGSTTLTVQVPEGDYTYCAVHPHSFMQGCLVGQLSHLRAKANSNEVGVIRLARDVGMHTGQ